MHKKANFTESLLSLFDQPSALLNEDFEISHVSDSLCTLLNATSNKLIGTSFLDVFEHSGGKSKLKRKLKGLLESAAGLADEDVVCIAKNLEDLKLSLSARLVEAEKKAKSILVVFKSCGEEEASVSAERKGASYFVPFDQGVADKTELKEEIYGLLYEHAGEPIFTYDKSLRIIDLNNKACESVGYEKEELLGKNILELGMLHPEDEEKVMMYIESIFRGEDHIRVEKVRIKGRDGTYRIYNVTAAAVHSRGKLLGITNVCHDITEVERLLEQLRESEEKYRAIVESSHAGVLVVDDKYTIQFANSVLCEMLKRSEQEVVGHDFREFIDEGSVQLVADRYLRRQRGEDVPSRYDFYIVRKDGEKRLVELSSTVVRDSRGKIKTISQILDITDRRKAEEEKKKLNAQLMHAQKMEAIGRLAGGMAHDFNNVLNVIIGYAELIKERISPESGILEDIDEVIKAGNSAFALTKKLLAFARSEMIEPRVVNFNDAVEEIVKFLHRLVGEDIDVRFFPGKELWNVKMDPAQIEHILANLATNARDAIPGTGTITIETANVLLSDDYCRVYPDLKPGEYVVIEFTDSGVGMDTEIQKKIFEPFFTTKEHGKGTGLGLSIVYGVVKQNGGLINVYSEPEKGTTFKLYFPRYKGEDIKNESQPKIAVGDLSGAETVLVVDDRGQIVSVCKKTLERLGYSVLTAMNPMEAIELARSYDGDIDLIIADVILPEMNGRELAREISSIKPKIKAIYMSGYTANAIAHRGILDPSINFLQKPFTPVELAAEVRRVLDEK